MSKTMKNFLIRDYQQILDGVEDALVISIRGVDANSNNRLRMGLAEKEISITVVRNSLAKKAFEGTGLAGLSPVMEGPAALAYGGETVVDVARELTKWAKEIENLELKGAILDGHLFEGAEGVEKLSKMPTRDEAISQAVTLILSPGRNLVGQILGPGRTVAGLVKAIEDKLEKGETIAKTG